jgi:hypothetical protein
LPSVDPASTTKSYTKPTAYIAPAASITQSGELLRLTWIIREGAQDFGLGGAVARFFVASVTR